jgi:hypothetical protein
MRFDIYRKVGTEAGVLDAGLGDSTAETAEGAE